MGDPFSSVRHKRCVFSPRTFLNQVSNNIATPAIRNVDLVTSVTRFLIHNSVIENKSCDSTAFNVVSHLNVVRVTVLKRKALYSSNIDIMSVAVSVAVFSKFRGLNYNLA